MTSLTGDFRSPDVTWCHSCHVTASPGELQPCRKWNVQFTQLFVLLQQLPGDFRSNDVTCGSLTVTWGNVTSFPVTWLPPPASCNLVGCQMYSICQNSPSTPTTRWPPVKWRHFRVTSAHLRSRDVIFCYVTASSCEQHPCWKWNVQYTPVFGLLQPVQSDFRSNDATSGSLSVTWGYVTSFPVMWLPHRASCSLVGSEMYGINLFLVIYSHFQVTSGKMTSLPGHFWALEDKWRHFLPRDFLLLRATALQEMKCTVYGSFRPSTATSGWLPFKWRDFLVTSVSPSVTRTHATSFPVTWLLPPASCILVGSEMHRICQFSSFYSQYQVTSGQMTSFWISFGHLRSRDVISCHVTASSFEL